MSSSDELWKTHWYETSEDFGWMLRYRHTDHWLDYEAYKMTASSDERMYERKGAQDGFAMTSNIEEAEVTISGYVKWDGCTEFTLNNTHFCGRADLKETLDLLLFIHDFARIALGRQDESCFD